MDTEFTPRKGKPVEINALWVHALSEGDAMGIETPVSPESALEAFQRFWNPERSCLYDLIDPVDPAIRPNQVIALSLGLIPQHTGNFSPQHDQYIAVNTLRTSVSFAVRPGLPGPVYR